ncbi:hypothetical protein ACJ72_00750 [Emergomyces africanus]|uniref:Uncharacterized protein n=1 Tax=Emergomyces africanus TaxID=1955775 RepID=A0A1B7P7A3_9EURO|nr:hypothetical protein ACJ72_00750 [Emergomyces africanus]
MAPKFKKFSMSKAKRGQIAAQGRDPDCSKREITTEIPQPRSFPPGRGGNSVMEPPSAKPPPAVMQNRNISEPSQRPKIYYPKGKKATDKAPNSAPLLPRGHSFSGMTEQPLRTVRKVSSTPRLKGEQVLFGGNRATTQMSISPASSEESAESSQEDYCHPPPKLEGIILGSPDLSLTRKGTCGTRGSGKLIVPERKASSNQGSIRIDDSEEYVYRSGSTVSPRSVPCENDTQGWLPRQNLTPSSIQLHPHPPAPMGSGQLSQSQGASSHNSSFTHGRNISRIRGEKDSSRNPAISNKSQDQGGSVFVQTPIHMFHGHCMAPETSPGQDSNLENQFEAVIQSEETFPQVLSLEGAPQNEIIFQLKSLSEKVAGIQIEQMKINKHLEDTNSQLQAFSEELQLARHARFWNLASYEKSINNHITQVVGAIGEAVESVAVTVAKISGRTAEIGFDDSKAGDGNGLEWSDAVEEEAHDTFARTPMTTYRAPFDQDHVGPSTVQNTGERRGSDGEKVNIGSPVRKVDSQTNPLATEDTPLEQVQQRVGSWRGPSTTQKRGFWSHKRHNGRMNQRGSASGSRYRKAATPSSAGQHPSTPVAPQAQEAASPSSYPHSQVRGGYEDQSYIHPATRGPVPTVAYGQASRQHTGFPPRQSSMRHHHTYMRGGGGPSNRNYPPHRDFSPNYGSSPPQSGQGQPQPNHLHFQATQNIGNNPPVGQWPAAQPEFNAYRPWAGVSNWYHQLNPQ